MRWGHVYSQLVAICCPSLDGKVRAYSFEEGLRNDDYAIMCDWVIGTKKTPPVVQRARLAALRTSVVLGGPQAALTLALESLGR